MPRLLSLSRAARLVGTTRGTLQKRVQDGEIASFEGMLRLSELSQLYPQASTLSNVIFWDSALLWCFAARRSAQAMARSLSSAVTPSRNTTGAPAGLVCQHPWPALTCMDALMPQGQGWPGAVRLL